MKAEVKMVPIKPNHILVKVVLLVVQTVAGAMLKEVGRRR